ncbi:UDP-3-O-acyl-N-acetylglucosamine deacetylase [Parvularcula dongshanensis]|uniref:UDP-3-O-acyl-N-acetylglucosamine deacetylase n=1 Tax=Parvularcula dongshanensis TaxID=1173995 RepID=A0A840I2C9_9PROT|nr:UDP-3-O-acyl-N-acetylglucosamine deacetylase [Parvularcula dongshanensis]MBB4658441.1 UDP-3-O-[3-hydroxymyristoyl] N-acetylglucosamine deacetylase [Parvularcula dongshanensis]
MVIAVAQARTVRASVACEGIGLHSGRAVALALRPAPAGTGVLFRRMDLLEGGAGDQSERLSRVTIPATPFHVASTTLGTVLSNVHGASVSTVEHLMAALAGCGIDNAIVELDGPEVPIMDGSAEPFLEAIERVGVRSLPAPRRALRVTAPIHVGHGDAMAVVEPLDADEAPAFRVDVTVDYPDQLIGRQQLTLKGSADAFRRDVAAARTFCYLSDVEAMRAQGLALGGSLDNAIVVADGAVLNEEGLRFDGEFVRHKTLDLIGDLHLLCKPVIGRVTAYKPGHTLNTMLAAAIAASTDVEVVTLLDADQARGRILA